LREVEVGVDLTVPVQEGVEAIPQEILSREEPTVELKLQVEQVPIQDLNSLEVLRALEVIAAVEGEGVVGLEELVELLWE